MVGFNKIRHAIIAFIFVAPTMLMATEFSLEECQTKAADGHAEAQWQLGQRYENGDGVKKNNMKALAQYKKAAEQRHRMACAKLADYYENGKFVKKILCLRQSIKLGLRVIMASWQQHRRGRRWRNLKRMKLKLQ